MNNEIFLTFDMDWANDFVLRHFHNMIRELGICGTLFTTHITPVLNEIRTDSLLELGIHPNFNKLLENTDDKTANIQTKINDLLKIVPEAVSVRSHSLTQSSIISRCFAICGLKYELNHFFPVSNNTFINSYHDIWGMTQVPFIFEDDIYLLSDKKYSIEWFLGQSFHAPRVFNFHPIHLFLNTDSMERYENSKPFTNDYKKLKQYVNTEFYGIENIFKNLVMLAKKNKYQFKKISDII